MGKAIEGSAKYISKKIKASGLQKIRNFCQLCLKQCRDSNGFKNHVNSSSHQKKVNKIVNDDKSKVVLESYSMQFRNDFLRLLKFNHGTKKVDANKFYQEYILNDKNHIHMNSTRWKTLTSFVKYLKRCGLINIYEDDDFEASDFTLIISLINKSQDFFEQKNKLEFSSLVDEKLNEKIFFKQIEIGEQKALLSSKKNKVDHHDLNKNNENNKIILKKNNNLVISKKNIFSDSDSN